MAASPRPSLHRLNERLRAGPPITSALITMPSVAAMQIWARSGVDLLIIDMEHGYRAVRHHAELAREGTCQTISPARSRSSPARPGVSGGRS